MKSLPTILLFLTLIVLQAFSPLALDPLASKFPVGISALAHKHKRPHGCVYARQHRATNKSIQRQSGCRSYGALACGQENLPDRTIAADTTAFTGQRHCRQGARQPLWLLYRSLLI